MHNDKLDDVLDSSILIIGAGIAGLITAKTLLEDGFTGIAVISSADRVGGVWAGGDSGGVYPGLLTNSMQGNFELSALPMPEEDLDVNEHRIKGETVSRYLEEFYQRFLKGKVQFRFGTTAIGMTRDRSVQSDGQHNSSGWLVTTEERSTKTQETRRWDKVVLCQGPHSIPSFPPCLDPSLLPPRTQPESASSSSHSRPLILHTSQIHTTADEEILRVTAPVTNVKSGKPENVASEGNASSNGNGNGIGIGNGITEDVRSEAGRIVVIGCGKSAIDLAARYASRGRRVTVIFRKPKYFSGHNLYTDYLIKTRIISTIHPAQVLTTVFERVLHGTRLGAWWLRRWQKKKDAGRNSSLAVDRGSPLYRDDIEPIWRGPDVNGGRSSATRPDSFHRLVANGTIRAISGVSPVRLTEDGKGLVLTDGEVLQADVIVCGTGFRSSFGFIPKDERLALGIEPIPPASPPQSISSSSTSTSSYSPLRHHASLRNPPAPPSDEPSSHVYKGIVPVGAWVQRDLVTNGFQGLLGLPLSAEISSHWISAFFQRDPNLRLPSSASMAHDHTERHAQWLRARFPLSTLPYDTQNHFPLYNATQYNDALLVDMGLRTFREKTGWFGLGWYYGTTEVRNYKDLAKERLEATLRGRDGHWFGRWLGW